MPSNAPSADYHDAFIAAQQAAGDTHAQARKEKLERENMKYKKAKENMTPEQREAAKAAQREKRKHRTPSQRERENATKKEWREKQGSEKLNAQRRARRRRKKEEKGASTRVVEVDGDESDMSSGSDSDYNWEDIDLTKVDESPAKSRCALGVEDDAKKSE